MRNHRVLLALAVSGALAFGVAACGDDEEPAASSGTTEEAASAGGDISGSIAIDGSSTVAPFAEAAAELFNEEYPDVQITVGTSGTGGGFEKFCAGETDISDASRPIKDDEEAPICEKGGVKYTEVVVANDGIAVATSKNLAVDCLTVDQLKQVWNKGSKVKSLSEVDPKLPDTELSLYGPGTDSGTFDFFTDQINGEEGVSREDYEASEDDNQLVTGVAGDDGGLGYFGFSYYEGAADQLNLIGVDSGDGTCVKPSHRGDPGRLLQAALAPAVHVPEHRGDGPARGQGVHGVRRRPGPGDRRGRQDRAAHRRAGHDVEGRARQGRERRLSNPRG